MYNKKIKSIALLSEYLTYCKIMRPLSTNTDFTKKYLSKEIDLLIESNKKSRFINKISLFYVLVLGI